MWGEYVPVGTRIARAQKKMKQLAKKGKKIEPVEIEGRKIVKEFWGNQWCDHFESFSDFSNRLPRGRTYARNGSICHLSIQEGCVEAFIAGSSLYEVKMTISKLKKSEWAAIKERCAGQIASLLELLSGKLSESVMGVVANHEDGLFPNDQEIKFSCNCPDWADMCKHVAAVFYGIGNRLDEQPDLLFLLRGVDPSELISSELTTTAEKTDDILDGESLTALFDIEMEDEPQGMTGIQLHSLRKKMNLSVKELANRLEVTPASIYRWEKTQGSLNIHKNTMDALLNFKATCKFL